MLPVFGLLYEVGAVSETAPLVISGVLLALGCLPFLPAAERLARPLPAAARRALVVLPVALVAAASALADLGR